MSDIKITLSADMMLLRKRIRILIGDLSIASGALNRAVNLLDAMADAQKDGDVGK